MSDSFAFSESAAFDISIDKKSEKKFSKTKLLKIFVMIFIVFLIVQTVIYFVVLPCLAPVHIRFTGLKNLSEQALLKDFEPLQSQTWIGFDTALVAANLVNDPLIESVQVEKIFPDQVHINVTERSIAAVALANVNGKTIPIQIDKNGVLFKIDQGMPAGNVPIISGLVFEQLRVGLRLHEKLRPLMERFSEILAVNAAYFSVISEIQIVPKESGNYDLILYPMNSKVKVLVDRTLNEETLKYMIVILDVLNSIDNRIKEVDLRYGVISYKTTGENGFE